MSVQVEKLEKNMAKLTIEVSSEEFENAIAKAYKKNKNKISMPGFRKGKAPRAMIEKMYGKGIFYENAMPIQLFLMLMLTQLKRANLRSLHSLKSM